MLGPPLHSEQEMACDAASQETHVQVTASPLIHRGWPKPAISRNFQRFFALLCRATPAAGANGALGLKIRVDIGSKRRSRRRQLSSCRWQGCTRYWHICWQRQSLPLPAPGMARRVNEGTNLRGGAATSAQ